MNEGDAREIFQRLGQIEQTLASLTGILGEREKTCSQRHENMDSACGAIGELKGAWKMLTLIAACVGSVVTLVGQFLIGKVIH